MSREFSLALAEEQIRILRKSIAKLKEENERLRALADEYITAYEKLAFGEDDDETE